VGIYFIENVYCSQISYITPKGNIKCLCKSDLKYFVRTLLRRLFTYSLASYYSWRGFRGNFQIGNLTIVQVIFGKYLGGLGLEVIT